jgi:hypothetical protein
MRDDLVERCAREFENHIRGLFENPRIIPGSLALAEIPVIGGLYLADHECLIPILLPQICAALCARERFRQDAPDWAPILPLRSEDCEVLELADDHRLCLVGLYGSSLRDAFWDLQHPPFATFASGLLAYEHTPDELRNDRELRREFPPRKLKGLCDGRLDWRSPERLAFDRHLAALVAAQEARCRRT